MAQPTNRPIKSYPTTRGRLQTLPPWPPPLDTLRRRKGESTMYTARKKIQKDKGLEPSEFEDSVAQVARKPSRLTSLLLRVVSALRVSPPRFRVCRHSSTWRMAARSSRATLKTSTSTPRSRWMLQGTGRPWSSTCRTGSARTSGRSTSGSSGSSRRSSAARMLLLLQQGGL
uniref:Uncharacterized protein n=1 Tax=Aegilops tauschii subsp. strangulata TaxID=200361 RepID=A0A452Y752_AEGTS